MIRLNYTYPNENAEFVSEIVKCVYEFNNQYGWHITDLDIIANDREDYLCNKPMFSERVFDFQKQVDYNHKVYINTAELIEILFESRTVFRGVFIYEKRNYCLEKSQFSVDDDLSAKSMFEMKILDGDLISIYSDDSKLLSIIEGKFKIYKND